MKVGLIILNFFLIVIIVFGVVKYMKPDQPLVKPKENSGKTSVSAEPEKTVAPSRYQVPETQLAILTEQNIFDSSRAPNTVTGAQSSNTQVEMTLVGTYTVNNDLAGAIIVQKKKTINPQQNLQNIMGPGGRGGPPQQQTQSNTNTDGRRRFGVQQTEEPEDNTVFQQHIRVGETLDNGYTLKSVTRTSAVLSKSGSQNIELQLVEPSKAPGVAAQTTSSNSIFPNNMTPEQFAQIMEQRRAEWRERMQQNNNDRANPGERGGNPPGGRNDR